MKNVTFRKLQSLLAIETHRKIVDAAKAFGLTAPAITLQLKQLEEDAGVTLFERMPHGMFPTEAGKVFVEAAKEIDERLQRLDDDINAFRRVKRGHITVGAVSTVKYFAPPLFAAFSKEYPDVHLRTDHRSPGRDDCPAKGSRRRYRSAGTSAAGYFSSCHRIRRALTGRRQRARSRLGRQARYHQSRDCQRTFPAPGEGFRYQNVFRALPEGYSRPA